MLFCVGEGKYESKGEGYQKNNRIFNQQVTSDEFDKARKSRPEFELPIAKWIDKKDMTDEEKNNSSSWEQTGGYLKTLSYKDAWKEAKMSDEWKKWVKGLPHFSTEIFEQITGLKWEDETSLVGKIVEVKVGGKTYKATITS